MEKVQDETTNEIHTIEFIEVRLKHIENNFYYWDKNKERAFELEMWDADECLWVITSSTDKNINPKTNT